MPASEIIGVLADFCKEEEMGVVLLEILVPDAESCLTPVEDLDAIAAAVEKDEQTSRHRILLQGRFGQGNQAVSGSGGPRSNTRWAGRPHRTRRADFPQRALQGASAENARLDIGMEADWRRQVEPCLLTQVAPMGSASLTASH